jgi:RsiW-degrading membrane proteinase PrsW (M82 family)
VWALARSKITPAQGFSAGLISGAAFALVESLGYLATPSGSGWLGVVVGRTGTGLLHVTTTGLIGWALASAWEEKHYRRLVLAYLGAVGLHSFWNIFGLLVALPLLIGQASVQTSTSVGFFVNLGQLAPFALGIEVILLLLILFAINRQFTKGKINGLD